VHLCVFGVKMKSSAVILLLISYLLFDTPTHAFGKQSYKVKGKFVCGDQPVANAKLTLYDEDTGSADEIMDTGLTGRDGSFILEGTASDPLPGDDIDPFLKLLHSCNKRAIKACDIKTVFELPQIKRYFDGTFYNVGTVNVETHFRADSSQCGA